MFALFAFIGMPGIPELLIILVIMLLLFGTRLPNVMRSLGQGITEFKKGVRDDEPSDATSNITHEQED